MMGQGIGLVIYSRNIYFIRSNKKSESSPEAASTSKVPAE
jgi:hypothetical protein